MKTIMGDATFVEAMDFVASMVGSYEEMKTRIAYMLAERFGEKAAIVASKHDYWSGRTDPDEAQKRLEGELGDNGIVLKDADRKILQKITIANDLYKKAKTELAFALAIHKKGEK